MTQAEKTAKIVDLEMQLRKIRRVQKFLETKPYRKEKHNRWMRRIIRTWGLSNNFFTTFQYLLTIQSQFENSKIQTPTTFDGIFNKCK